MSDLEYIAADFSDWYILEIIKREFPEANFLKRCALFHYMKTGSYYKMEQYW